jgi:hypothetical protein
MGILIKVIHPCRVEGRRSPLYTMNLVALVEKKLGEIRSVLSGNTGDQRNFFCHSFRTLHGYLLK